MVKLSLRFGDVAVDYEGPAEFIKEELHTIIKTVSELGGVTTPIKRGAGDSQKDRVGSAGLAGGIGVNSGAEAGSDLGA